MAAPALAGPGAEAEAEGMLWPGLWPLPEDAEWHGGARLGSGVPRAAEPRPEPGLFLYAAPGLRIGAEAGFSGSGGGFRAMVALKLDF